MIIAFVLALAGAAFLVFVTAAARNDGLLAFVPGGARVRKGYYFATRSWTLTPVSEDGGVLAGAESDRYLRVPLVAAIVLAPLMGALFVISLPFLSVYVVARALLSAAARATKHGAKEIAATVVPGVRVGDAHLTGRGENDAGGPSDAELPGSAPDDDHLDALEKEIRARRHPDEH